MVTGYTPQFPSVFFSVSHIVISSSLSVLAELTGQGLRMRRRHCQLR